MTRAGQRLIEGMNESIAIARGEADPSTYKIHTGIEIFERKYLSAKIRIAQGLTQAEFAAKYNIGLSRLQDWEQGRSKPDSLALAYLTVIEKENEAVERALKPS